MSLNLCGLAGIGLACVLVVPAHAQLLQRKDLSYAMAKTIAEGAIEACKAKGFNIAVVVVDRAGDTIVAMRRDNVNPHNMENARRKAYTAGTFRRSTAEFAKQLADGNQNARQQVTLPNVIAIGGGLPIKVGDEVIAGGGVSGSQGGNDEPCLQAGIDKVKDQLK